MALNVGVLEKFACNSTILEGARRGLLGASNGPEREGFRNHRKSLENRKKTMAKP